MRGGRMRGLTVVAIVAGCLGCGGSGRGSSPGNGAPPPAPIPGLFVDPSVSARVLFGGVGSPDDLAVAPDGTVYVGDEQAGELSAWSPSTGQLRRVARGLSHPEGIVALDGLLVVCEQGKNRLSRVDPGDGSVSPFHALSNSTANLGVDGLAFDPLQPSIIVPDSPNGTLLRVSLDGATATSIPVAGGRNPPFLRPTGAFVLGDGSLLVADEDGGEILLRRPDGSVQTIATGLGAPDDVIGDARGNVYTNTLGDGALHRLQGEADVKLVTGLDTPHGLAFDLDGNVLVTDLADGGRVIQVFVH